MLIHGVSGGVDEMFIVQNDSSPNALMSSPQWCHHLSGTNSQKNHKEHNKIVLILEKTASCKPIIFDPYIVT